MPEQDNNPSAAEKEQPPKTIEKKPETINSVLAETKTNITIEGNGGSKKNEEILKKTEADPSLASDEKGEIKQTVETAQTDTQKTVKEVRAKIAQLEEGIQAAQDKGEDITAADLKEEKKYWQSKIETAQEKEKLAAMPEGKKAEKTQKKIKRQEIQQQIFETKAIQAESAEQKQQKIRELKIAAEAAEREKTLGQKLATLCANKEIGKRFVLGQVNALASSLGVRTIYSLPTWIQQRTNVRGEWGKKGLEGRLQDVLGASQEHKKRMESKEAKLQWEKEIDKIAANIEKDTNSKGKSSDKSKKIKNRKEEIQQLTAKIEMVEGMDRAGQKQAMAKMMRVVKMTKEGGQKSSDLRNELARLIKESRNENRNLNEQEQAEVKKLIDKHAETKITGLETARDGLNSICVASGAFYLRILTRGLFDAAGRYQKLKRAAGEEDSVNIIKDVIAGGIAETFKKTAFVYGKDKDIKQRGLEFASALGTLASYYGMGALSLRPERFTADLGRVVETLQSDNVIGKVGKNIFQNAAIVSGRYARIAKLAAKPFTALSGALTGEAAAESNGPSLTFIPPKTHPKGQPSNLAESLKTTKTAPKIDIAKISSTEPKNTNITERLTEEKKLTFRAASDEQPAATDVEHIIKSKNAKVADLFKDINENPDNPDFIDTHDKIFPGNEVVLTYKNGSTEIVTVKEGDNLWNIAKSHAPGEISEVGLRQGTAARPPEDLLQSPKPRDSQKPIFKAAAEQPENVQPENEALKPRSTPAPEKPVAEPIEPIIQEKTTSNEIKIEPPLSPEQKPVEDLGKIDTTPPEPKKHWDHIVGAFVQDDPEKDPLALSQKDIRPAELYEPKRETIETIAPDAFKKEASASPADSMAEIPRDSSPEMPDNVRQILNDPDLHQKINELQPSQGDKYFTADGVYFIKNESGHIEYSTDLGRNYSALPDNGLFRGIAPEAGHEAAEQAAPEIIKEPPAKPETLSDDEIKTIFSQHQNQITEKLQKIDGVWWLKNKDGEYLYNQDDQAIYENISGGKKYVITALTDWQPIEVQKIPAGEYNDFVQYVEPKTGRMFDMRGLDWTGGRIKDGKYAYKFQDDLYHYENGKIIKVESAAAPAEQPVFDAGKKPALDLDGKSALEKKEVLSDLTHQPILEKLPEVEISDALMPNKQGSFEGAFSDLKPEDVSGGEMLEQAEKSFLGLKEGNKIYELYVKMLYGEPSNQKDSAIQEFKGLVRNQGALINERIARTMKDSFAFDASYIDKPEYLENFLDKQASGLNKPDKVAFYRLLVDYQTIKELKENFKLPGGRVETSPDR